MREGLHWCHVVAGDDHGGRNEDDASVHDGGLCRGSCGDDEDVGCCPLSRYNYRNDVRIKPGLSYSPVVHPLLPSATLHIHT